MTIANLFYPRGVAVVGSMTEGKLGNVLTRQVLQGGFKPVYAINPKGQGLPGAPGFRALANIGEPVDLAIVAAPAQTVVEVLEDCGQAGVTAAVIITAGFSEAGNSAGEAELKRVARKHGIRFVGPNCAGIFNTANDLYPTLETRPPKGATALLSQSGALGGAILAWAEEQGLGFSKFVSYGNRADLDEVELLNYLADDPETKVVAFYIESLANGRAFMEAASAFTKRKPLVVIKAGRTQSGLRATLSHTGSMAGSDTVYDSALRECGAIRVHSVEEMFDLCKGFTFLSPVKGKRVCVVTNSGGPGVLAADEADRLGLLAAEPSEAVRTTLAGFLPAHCAFRNPIDLTVEGTEETYQKTLEAMLSEFDAAVAINVCPPYLPSLPLARGIQAAQQTTGKPIAVNFMAGKTVADSVPFLREAGLPNFVTGERAMAVLAALAQYAQNAGSQRASFLDLPAPKAERLGDRALLEPEAMALLKQNGISVPPFAFCQSAAEVASASREIGFPLVMKVVSPEILHKSDFGGVILNVASEAAARSAFNNLKGIAQGKDFRGVVIYPMVKHGTEVLLGLSHDPQFGPVVAFGLGGIFTEILKDVALRVAPVDQAEALQMIRETKAHPMLTGARGRTVLDLDALATTIAALSRLPFLYPQIREVDLNPVFLFETGLVVGDARVILGE